MTVGKLKMLEDLVQESCCSCKAADQVVLMLDFKCRDYRMVCSCGHDVEIPDGKIRDGESMVHVANTVIDIWNTAMRKLKL